MRMISLRRLLCFELAGASLAALLFAICMTGCRSTKRAVTTKTITSDSVALIDIDSTLTTVVWRITRLQTDSVTKVVEEGRAVQQARRRTETTAGNTSGEEVQETESKEGTAAPIPPREITPGEESESRRRAWVWGGAVIALILLGAGYLVRQLKR